MNPTGIRSRQLFATTTARCCLAAATGLGLALGLATSGLAATYSTSPRG